MNELGRIDLVPVVKILWTQYLGYSVEAQSQGLDQRRAKVLKSKMLWTFGKLELLLFLVQNKKKMVSIMKDANISLNVQSMILNRFRELMEDGSAVGYTKYKS